MAEYQQLRAPDGTISGSVLRVADQAHIPDDPANVDFQRYTEWLAEGNTPDPPAPPPLAPQIVQSAQALQIQQAQQLAAQGRTDEALAAVLAILGGQTP